MAGKVISTPFDALTYQIIGCAMAVHRELGPGLRENSYQRALASKLSDAGYAIEQQKLFEVYEGSDNARLAGYYIPDFVVEGVVIVEIKALRGIDNSHLAQMIGYLAVSTCPVGLLINFGERSLYHRRIFPPHKVVDDLINRQWLFVPDWLKEEKGHG
jgi:GxxExxY protein